MDKLKGLKLGTDASDLTGKQQSEGAPSQFQNPLSPESSDVAVGSFGSFAALKGEPVPTSVGTTTSLPSKEQRRMVAQQPPESFAAQQRQHAGMGSLNAFASDDTGFTSRQQDDVDDDDDLFALPMSPRSPEMTKSPFSFAAQDTMKYVKGEKA